jgi:hypothetical protein
MKTVQSLSQCKTLTLYLPVPHITIKKPITIKGLKIKTILWGGGKKPYKIAYILNAGILRML